MAAVCLLRFLIFKFLTDDTFKGSVFVPIPIFVVGQLKMVELRRRAKFGQNQSNRSRDMAIFRFFKMAVAAAVLDC